MNIKLLKIALIPVIFYASSLSAVFEKVASANKPWGIVEGESYIVPGCKLAPQSEDALRCFLLNGTLEQFTLNWKVENEVRYLFSRNLLDEWDLFDLHAFFGSRACGATSFSVTNMSTWSIDINDRWMRQGIEKGVVFACPQGVPGEWDDIPLIHVRPSKIVNASRDQPCCLLREQLQVFKTVQDPDLPFTYGCRMKVRLENGKTCTLFLPTVKAQPPAVGVSSETIFGLPRIKRDGFLKIPEFSTKPGCVTKYAGCAGQVLGYAGIAVDGFTRVQTFCNDVAEGKNDGMSDSEVIASGLLVQALELVPGCNLREALSTPCPKEGRVEIDGESFLYDTGRWTGDTFYYKQTDCRGAVWYPSGAGNWWNAWSEGVMGTYESIWTYAEKCKDHPAPGMGMGFGGPTFRR